MRIPLQDPELRLAYIYNLIITAASANEFQVIYQEKPWITIELLIEWLKIKENKILEHSKLQIDAFLRHEELVGTIKHSIPRMLPPYPRYSKISLTPKMEIWITISFYLSAALSCFCVCYTIFHFGFTRNWMLNLLFIFCTLISLKIGVQLTDLIDRINGIGMYKMMKDYANNLSVERKKLEDEFEISRHEQELEEHAVKLQSFILNIILLPACRVSLASAAFNDWCKGKLIALDKSQLSAPKEDTNTINTLETDKAKKAADATNFESNRMPPTASKVELNPSSVKQAESKHTNLEDIHGTPSMTHQHAKIPGDQNIPKTDHVGSTNTDTYLTWLHLSDMHICRSRSGWDSGRILDQLIKDLSFMEKTFVLRPQFLFFTGDAVFGETGPALGRTIKEQFGEAEEFLQLVRMAFATPIEKRNVLIVPGNHDVNRYEATPALVEWLDIRSKNETDSHFVNEMLNSEQKQFQSYMERLSAYKNFLEDQGYTHLLSHPKHLMFSLDREIGVHRMRITGLNTAWSSCRDGEKGRLWMGGGFQIGHLRSEHRTPAEVSIVLMHHPTTWLVEQESLDVARQIEQEFDFCLHGHEHRDWVEQVQSGFTRIAAGACYEYSNRPTGYNFVRINLRSGATEVWLRHYERQGGSWIPNIIAGKTNNDGRWMLENFRKRSF